MTLRRQPRKFTNSGYLDGQLLIAMPAMADRRFARSVIYMCAHSDEGAMGLIINQRAPNLSFADLLERLQLLDEESEANIPPEVLRMAIHVGGPVEPERGFVLHSSDYFTPSSTLPISDEVCLTATIDILKALAAGEGPNKAILALGYAGWAPGQLESEIHANGWLSCQADLDLIFDLDVEEKYERALSKLGIDPMHLVNAAGHA
ncbi:MAG: YqgE/AlgH family protein [Pseudomonadota bacterium]|jgi:putative transcriptional regulator|nr:MAG: YqgE/AlgH family protein [Pseudomonadota bacterium]